MAILEQATKKYGDNITNNTGISTDDVCCSTKNAQLSPLGTSLSCPFITAVLPHLTAMASGISSVIGVLPNLCKLSFRATCDAQTKAANEQQTAAVSGLGDA